MQIYINDHKCRRIPDYSHDSKSEKNEAGNLNNNNHSRRNILPVSPKNGTHDHGRLPTSTNFTKQKVNFTWTIQSVCCMDLFEVLDLFFVHQEKSNLEFNKHFAIGNIQQMCKRGVFHVLHYCSQMFLLLTMGKSHTICQKHVQIIFQQQFKIMNHLKCH